MNNENPTPAEYSHTQADYLVRSRVAEAHRARVLLGELEGCSTEYELIRLRACVLDMARGNSVAEEIYRTLTGKVPYKDCFNPFGSLSPEIETAFAIDDYLFELKAKDC